MLINLFLPIFFFLKYVDKKVLMNKMCKNILTIERKMKNICTI